MIQSHGSREKQRETRINWDVLREDDIDPPIHTETEQQLGSSSQMEPTPSVPSSCAQKIHWNVVADIGVAIRDAGQKRRGSTGFVLGKLAGTPFPATMELCGANVKKII